MQKLNRFPYNIVDHMNTVIFELSIQFRRILNIIVEPQTSTEPMK